MPSRAHGNAKQPMHPPPPNTNLEVFKCDFNSFERQKTLHELCVVWNKFKLFGGQVLGSHNSFHCTTLGFSTGWPGPWSQSKLTKGSGGYLGSYPKKR